MSETNKKKKNKPKAAKRAPSDDYDDDDNDYGDDYGGGGRGDDVAAPKKKKKKKKKKPVSESSDDDDDDDYGGVEDDPPPSKKKKKKKSGGAEPSPKDANALLDEKIRAKKKKKKAALDVGPAYGDEEKVEEDVEAGYDDDFSDVERKHGSRGKGGGDGRGGAARKRPGASAVSGDDPSAAKQRGPGGGGTGGGPTQRRGKGFDPPGKKVNERYEELHTRGTWGGTKKWEARGLCLFFLAIVAGAVVVGVLLTRDNTPKTQEPTLPPTRSPTGAPTTDPTAAPTGSDYREQYGLEIMTEASPKLTLQVQRPEELRGAKFRESSTPQEVAAEFVLFDDEMQIDARDPRFLERYALAVFYNHNGGCAGEWNTRDNWLTSGMDHCEKWFGIKCKNGLVQEFDMSSNSVQRSLPVEIKKLAMMREFNMADNQLTGTVPVEAISWGTAFGIQLQNNKLEGDFPFEELSKKTGALETLWVQENPDLKGTLIFDYCGLQSLTIDCTNISPGNEFEGRCIEKGLAPPKEFTCNSGGATKATRAPIESPTASPAGNSGGTISTMAPTVQTYCGQPFGP